MRYHDLYVIVVDLKVFWIPWHIRWRSHSIAPVSWWIVIWWPSCWIGNLTWSELIRWHSHSFEIIDFIVRHWPTSLRSWTLGHRLPIIFFVQRWSSFILNWNIVPWIHSFAGIFPWWWIHFALFFPSYFFSFDLFDMVFVRFLRRLCFLLAMKFYLNTKNERAYSNDSKWRINTEVCWICYCILHRLIDKFMWKLEKIFEGLLFGIGMKALEADFRVFFSFLTK